MNELEAESGLAVRESYRVLDLNELRNRIGDDRELLREVIGLFLEDCPGWMEEIRDSVTRNDACGLKIGAHRLAGTARTLGAHEVAETARRLEVMAETGDLSCVQEAHRGLTEAMDRLMPVLVRFTEN